MKNAKMDYSEFTPAQAAQFAIDDAAMVRLNTERENARKLKNAYHDLLDLLDFIASQNGLPKQAFTDEICDDQNVMQDCGDLVKGSAQYWLRMDSSARNAAGGRAEALKFDLNKAAGKSIY